MKLSKFNTLGQQKDTFINIQYPAMRYYQIKNKSLRIILFKKIRLI